MSHIVLKKWNELKSKIEENEKRLDAKSLVELLLSWVEAIRGIKDIYTQKLYTQYLEYFEGININETLFVTKYVWYSIDEIIKVDLLSYEPKSFKCPIVKVRDVLWELLVFKSHESCKCCGDDNLRVLINNSVDDLFFACDICGCLLNEKGSKVKINTTLRPAPITLIQSSKIGVSPV